MMLYESYLYLSLSMAPVIDLEPHKAEITQLCYQSIYK